MLWVFILRVLGRVSSYSEAEMSMEPDDCDIQGRKAGFYSTCWRGRVLLGLREF